MHLCYYFGIDYSRSNNVEALRTDHIGWSNDALAIDFSKHKADQSVVKNLHCFEEDN